MQFLGDKEHIPGNSLNPMSEYSLKMDRGSEGMDCELAEGEIFILSVLWKSRNFRSDEGYHSKKLEKWYLRKAKKENWSMEFDECIQNLLNRGLIATIGKSPPKYYISDKKAVAMALTKCGINVRPGRYHPLLL